MITPPTTAVMIVVKNMQNIIRMILIMIIMVIITITLAMIIILMIR